jgi:hypothetical protein
MEAPLKENLPMSSLDTSTTKTATVAVATAAAVWTSSWTSALIKFIILTVILVIALIFMFTLGNLNEIRKNFPRYRCNPLFIPFASNFGYDTKDNFNFCLSTIFDSKAAEIFGPIYQLLAGFINLTKIIVDVALGIRKLFSNFLLGVNHFVQNVRDRIQQLLFNIRISFMRMQHLMARVYGTMYAVIWMGTSAITAGFNISDNSLVQFLFEFCFDPETPLQLADGSYIPIKDAQIGMNVAGGGKVTSVFEFDGSRTPMVKIDNVVLSSEHYVKYTSLNHWIPAKEHPNAQCVPSIPRLICLNVSNHIFNVGYTGLCVADYDEHSTPAIIQSTQQFAEKSLNGSSNNQENHQENEYELGVDPTVEIHMKDGSWKQISKIQIGDIVWNAGKVYGIVHEQVNFVSTINSIRISASQLVYDSTKHAWIRPIESCKYLPSTFIQLITANGTTMHIRSSTTKQELFIRDYREIPNPDMENAYIQGFSEKLSIYRPNVEISV